MIFAILMIAAAIAATVIMGSVLGWVAAGAFALVLFALYKAFTHQSGPDRRIDRDTLNAFQQPMADD